MKTLLVVLATLAVGAMMLSGNASLPGKSLAKHAELRAPADAGQNPPPPASLAALDRYATTARLSIPGGALGATVYNPRTRIEFVPVDINGDGDFTDENEGFIRVYRANTTTAGALNYVTARRWNPASATDPNATSPNCGDVSGGGFMTAADHNNATPAPHNHNTASTLANQRASLNRPSRRCYLGGDARLTNGWVVNTPAPGNYGQWLRWPGYGAGAAPAAIAQGAIHPALGGGRVGNAMADYLWPINRPFNPNFSGVIYVKGSVGISGVVRGQVTVAASGNVLLADDLIYVTAPGSIPDCNQNGDVWADILSVLTAQSVVIEDNSVNSPFQAGTPAYVKGYDETAGETIHGAVLTLNSVRSEAPGTGSDPEWTYDRCDRIKGPPPFPTTGRHQ